MYEQLINVRLIVLALDVAIPVDTDRRDNATAALLDDSIVVAPERYPISEFMQFYIILKRTLLFSCRDWVGIWGKQMMRLSSEFFGEFSRSCTFTRLY